MIKNYKAALDEAAEKETYSKICFNGLEYAFGLKTHENCIEAFKLGAEFAFNYQQAKIDKLVEALKYINGDHGIKIPALVKPSHIVTREALAQLEKDGE